MRSIMPGSPRPHSGWEGPGKVDIDSLPDRKRVEGAGTRARACGIPAEVDDHVDFMRIRPRDSDGRGAIGGAYTQDIPDAPRRLDGRPDRADDDPIAGPDVVDVPRPEGRVDEQGRPVDQPEQLGLGADRAPGGHGAVPDDPLDRGVELVA